MFHHLTYGSDAIGASAGAGGSARERAALEMQINEFGQCPRQIFRGPHAPRLVCPPVQLPGGGLLFSPCRAMFCTDFSVGSGNAKTMPNVGASDVRNRVSHLQPW